MCAAAASRAVWLGVMAALAVALAAIARAARMPCIIHLWRCRGATELPYDSGMPPRKKPVRRKKVAPASVGLTAEETRTATGAAVDRLAERVERDGGAVLARYRDPFGGTPVLFAALPIDRVEPTPYQRDPSDTHVKRLMGVIEKIGRFLDPIVVVPGDGQYLTPNGNHRLQALKKLGARTVTGLLVPDPDVAFKILALNTEKAHN